MCVMGPHPIPHTHPGRDHIEAKTLRGAGVGEEEEKGMQKGPGSRQDSKRRGGGVLESWEHSQMWFPVSVITGQGKFERNSQKGRQRWAHKTKDR
jgi:hypothetical protein